MTIEGLEDIDPSKYRVEKWSESDCHPTNEALPNSSEDLPCGFSLSRKKWVTLNRGRAKVGRTEDNLQKWGYTASAECPHGCPLGPTCTDTDLKAADEIVILWIEQVVRQDMMMIVLYIESVWYSIIALKWRPIPLLNLEGIHDFKVSCRISFFTRVLFSICVAHHKIQWKQWMGFLVCVYDTSAHEDKIMLWQWVV